MRHLCILATGALLLTACGGGGSGTTSASFPIVPTLVSKASVEGMVASNDDAEYPAISGDGLFVAFQDESGNFVLNDTNDEDDIGFFDATTGDTSHISDGIGGAKGDDDADRPSLDQDGSHCAFESEASNLVAGDTNGEQDIFVRVLQTGAITRVSVATDGTQANEYCGDPVLSADGSIIAFESEATNLVTDDTNDQSDIFVHDMNTGITTRVSVKSNGDQAVGGGCYDPAISADGNLVVWHSFKSDLVPMDGNGLADIFLHNRTTGVTTRLSTDTGGGDANGNSEWARISDNGNIVVYSSRADDIVTGDTNGVSDVFVHVIANGITTRVSVDSMGNEATTGDSREPDVSADGQYVVFLSYAPDLVAGDTNGRGDIFRHDRQTGTTIRVNVRADGSQALYGDGDDPVISDDGMRVAWDQGDCGLVPDGRRDSGNSNVFLKDLSTGALTLASTAADRSLADAYSGSTSISANGQWVIFASDATNLVAGDTNNQSDLFRYEVATGTLIRVFVSPEPSNPNDGGAYYEELSISNDGRFVCFNSSSPDLLGVGNDTNGRDDIFVLDTDTNQVTRVSVHTDGTEANDRSYNATMTPDGRYVLFSSRSTTLVTGDVAINTEMFLHDRNTGFTTRAVADKDGLPIEGGVFNGSISDDGRYIAFASADTDLVDTDANGNITDAFRHDRDTGTNIVISVHTSGAAGDNWSGDARISGDGSTVLFQSNATNLIDNDTNAASDIFVRDVTDGTTTRVSVDSAGNQSIYDGYMASRSLSFDGNLVLFLSGATDLVPGFTVEVDRGYLHDRTSGTTAVISVAPNGGPTDKWSDFYGDVMSNDGRLIVYRQSWFETTNAWMVDLSPILGD